MTNSFSRRDFFTFAAAAFTLPASAFSQEAATQQAGRGQGQGPGQRPGPRTAAARAAARAAVRADGMEDGLARSPQLPVRRYRKAAAFYATLMGWKVRSDDGKQAVLDIGENSGGIVIRGGMTAPPPPRSPTPGSA